jgi:hypothetical protein
MPVRPQLVDKFVLGTDIEAYSGRTAREHGEVQRSLDRILSDAAEAVGLDRAAWYRETAGDGEKCALPDGTDLVTVVRGFVEELGILLADHNQDHAAALRIRLRLAMHIDVMSDGPLGATGPAFVVLGRLLDSKPLRTALAGTRTADLALMISEPVYRKAVMSELGGLRPAQFRRVMVDIPAKGFHQTAYIRRIPGERPEPDSPAAEPEPEPEPAAVTPQIRVSGDYIQQGGVITGSSIGGDVVFGDQYVTGGTRPFVPVRTSEPEKRGWQGGADVTVGMQVFLLDESHLSERFSADYSTALRQARALLRGGRAGRRAGYAWLRQVEVIEPSAEAERALTALRRERELLDKMRGTPGFPRECAFETRLDGRLMTLALDWPSSHHGPYGTLSPGTRNGFQAYRLFGRLASLCDLLAVLHRFDVSHRALSREAVIGLDGGRVALRDLGLAAHAPRPAEGPVVYRAPEQRSRQPQPPGPQTDAYQVAALAYDLLTGHAPDPERPLSVGGLVPGLPGEIVRHIDAALRSQPSARPPVLALAAAFRVAWGGR